MSPAVRFVLFAAVPLLVAPDIPSRVCVLTPSEKAWVAAHPTVRMMVDPSYPPADFIDADGNHLGIAADVLALVAERTGLRFVPVPLDAAQRAELDPVKRGIDGVALSAITPDRQKYYATTHTFLEFPAYIITRADADDDRYLTPDDLAGKRVAVVSGYAAEEYLRDNYPAVVRVRVADTPAALRAVGLGEADALVSDIPVSSYYVERSGPVRLRINGESGYVYKLGITSRKDWPELNAILEKGLSTITAEEHEAIRRKWLTLPYQPLYDQTWVRGLGLAVCGLLAAVFLVLLWNRALARRVRQKTEALRQSEVLYRATLDGMADAVLLATEDGRLAWVGGGAAGVFGYPPEAVRGAGSVVNLLGKELADEVAAHPEGVQNFEVRLPGPSGGIRTVLVTVTPVRLATAVRLYVCREVTGRVRLEERLRQKKQLEAVGLLAAGLTHDFNNLLAAVRGFTELARDPAAGPDERTVYLNEVTQAADRAAHLTRQFLGFARPSDPSARELEDVGVVVAQFLPLVRGLLKPSAAEFQANGPLPAVIDKPQVEQVLLNLCLNARDAMPDGGTITVRAAEAERASRRYVRLAVADTGTGIRPEVRERMFDPFFTTKPTGKGTGLGLAIVSTAAEAHGGFVEVESEIGKGTTIAVYFPAA